MNKELISLLALFALALGSVANAAESHQKLGANYGLKVGQIVRVPDPYKAPHYYVRQQIKGFEKKDGVLYAILSNGSGPYHYSGEIPDQKVPANNVLVQKPSGNFRVLIGNVETDSAGYELGFSPRETMPAPKAVSKAACPSGEEFLKTLASSKSEDGPVKVVSTKGKKFRTTESTYSRADGAKVLLRATSSDSNAEKWRLQAWCGGREILNGFKKCKKTLDRPNNSDCENAGLWLMVTNKEALETFYWPSQKNYELGNFEPETDQELRSYTSENYAQGAP